MATPLVVFDATQIVPLHCNMFDLSGNPTTDLGTYSLSWSVDDARILAFVPGPVAGPGYDVDAFGCLVGPATPIVEGTANVVVTLLSSDPTNHPTITAAATATVMISADDVASIVLVWGAPTSGSLPA
jgi:hypothetical protein